MIDSADFIVVGGGSAGCALASRLSENPAVSVLLLEAGPEEKGLFADMPAGSVKLMPRRDLNWMYRTQPDPSLKDRVSIWHSGKMLGGGSSINGMVYIRGARQDYDGWSAGGCTGWSWNEVLPYFIRSERFQGPDAATRVHGREGPLCVAPLRSRHALTGAFVEACVQTGLRRIGEYCGGDVDGVFENYVTQDRGRRCSSAHAYLGLARGRTNLRVETGALVERIAFEGARASGVVYRRDGETRKAAARAEVILAAGTLQSPAILMRSGVGPAAQLKALGIEVIRDAPEVGKNLQEHASFATSRFVNVPTYNVMAGPASLAAQLLRYVLFRDGMLTTSPVHALAFLRSDASLPDPDIKLSMSPTSLDRTTFKLSEQPGMTVYANVSPPKSRGEIRLASANPQDAPVIDHRLLGSAEDMAALIKGAKRVDAIYRAPALARYVTGANFPREVPRDTPGGDDEWADLLRANAGIGFHPVATCRMGGDPRSVVDPKLRVRDVGALRVADASIMPSMPAANTNAPAIMIGEKAADLIRAGGL